MKKRIYIALLLLVTLCGAMRAEDITFDGRQKLYFNAGTSWIPVWNTSGAVFSAYFYRGSSGKFAGKAEHIEGNIYAVTVPAGTWSNVILTRHAPSTTIFDFEGAHGFWNESRSLSLKQYQWDNYISEFNIKGDGTAPYYTWNQLYSEQPKDGMTPAALASYWGLTVEDIHVCDNSTNDPFTLTPSTRETSGGKYEYNYDMRAHAWFKTTDNGATWHNVDGKAGIRASKEEGDMHCNTERVDVKGSVTYYYLYAKEANDQRLIRVSVDKDCSVNCEITSFEVTPTAVNVGDNTYTMDGIVAFTKAEGDLIIECDGKSVTIPSPESPQTFSLHDLTADGKAEDFRAYFSSMSTCEAHNYTTAPSPTTDAIVHPEKVIAPKEAVTLTPDAKGTDSWEWTLSGDPTILKSTGTNDMSVPLTTIDYDTELTYIYTEYNPTPTLPTNLMNNGGFEDVSVPYKWRTEYKNSNVLNGNQIWDGGTTDRMNIYDLPSFKGTYGYFGITNNVNTYWKLMTHVTPKEGTYLAVIDGDEVADKKAWYASTLDGNSNLKLMRGTTYLFSFWVANINNFGELVNNGRRNCAKLQFHIRCHSVEDDKWYEADLGNPIDLNDDKYIDFNWHQNSSTFSTRAYFGKDFNADEVTISVVDKNNTGLTIGNDFALDDIQFRAVSVVSKSIKAREFFKVKIFEPATAVAEPVVKITKTPACGKNDFTMDVTVNYSTLNNKFPVTLQLTDNKYGDILPTPITIDPATNPNSISLILSTADYAMLEADGKEHTLTAKITRLDGAGVDKGGQSSVTYVSPGIPAIKEPVLEEQNKACDKTTFDLQVATEYLAFKGTKLHYDWDGTEWTDAENPVLSYKESKWQTATGKLNNLLADGNNHTLRVYSDNGTLDCEYTVPAVTAPYMPQITKTTASVLPFNCDDVRYKVNVEVTFANPQGHNLIIEDWKGDKQTISTTASDTKKDYTFSYDWEQPATHEYKVYFEGAEACKDNHKPSFTSPFLAQIDAVTVENLPTGLLSCGTTEYNVNVKVNTHFDATGYDIILNYNDNGSDLSKTVAATGKVTTVPLILHNMDGADQTVTAQIDATPSCPKNGTYTPAKMVHITPLFDVTVGENACGPLDYTVSGTVEFNKADGDLIVYYDDTHSDTIAVPTDATSANFSIEHMSAPGSGLTLNAKFTGSLSDGCTVVSNTFAAPVIPAVTAAGFSYSDPSCGLVTTLTFDLDYTYQQGTLTYWVDDLTPVTATYSVADKTARKIEGLTFEGIPADGKPHTLHVSFDGANSCVKDYTLPAAPLSTVIDNVVITSAVPSMVTCATASYNVEVEVTTHFDATGKTVILTYSDNGVEQVSDPVTVIGRKASATLTVHNIANGSHAITAAFESTPACTTPSAPYTAPAIAQIHDFSVTVSPRTCGSDDYTVSGSIAFDMPDGDLIVEYDAEHRQVFAAPVTSPADFSIPMVAEGAGLTLKAWFTGSPSPACQKESAPFDAPVKPAIQATSFAYALLACDDVATTLTFDLDYTYQQGTLTYWVDDLTSVTATYSVADKTARKLEGLTFEGIPADGKPHTLHVQFDGANSCIENYTLPAAPLSPVIDAVKLTSAVPAMVTCATTSYDVEVEATSHYAADGKSVVFRYDDNGTIVTSAPVAFSGNKATTTLTLHNIANGSHTVSAAFEGTTCTFASAPYTAPSVAQIHDYSISVSPLDCGKDEYTLSGSIAFDMPDGDFIVEYDAEHRQVFAAPVTNPVNFSIPGMTADGASLELKAWFSGSPSCVKTSVFDAPAKPAISLSNVKPSDANCTTTSKVTFDLDYTYQQGTLTYWVDEMSAQTASYSVADMSEQHLYDRTFTDIPADGQIHTLHVQFDGANSCETSVDFKAPLTYAINSVYVSGVPTEILCGATGYTATVTVSLPYNAAIGKDIVLSYEGKESHVTVTSNPFETVVPLTTTDATGLTVTAHFSDAPYCIVPSNPYDAPVQLSCVKTEATVCEGTSYLWSQTGVSYGPFTVTGKDTITNPLNDHDTLIVTVRPYPEIVLKEIDTLFMDDAQILLPYTITHGTPDLFDVTIHGVTTSQSRGESDILVVDQPSGITPGDYTISVEVKDTKLTCTTQANLKVHVAGVPAVTAFSVTPQDIDCDAATYQVNVHVEYMNPHGRLVIEDKTNGNTYYYTLPSAPYGTPQSLDEVITVTSLVPATVEWEAYFEGRVPLSAISYTPSQPSIQLYHVTPSAPDCNTTSEVTFDLDYTYQQGTLTYWVDGMPEQTESYSVADATERTLSGLTFAGIPADGLEHTLHVKFDGPNSCEQTALFASPLTHAISGISVSGVPATVLCDQTEYTATVTISLPIDASGQKLILTREGSDTAVIITSNPMDIVLPLHTVDAKGLTVSVRYCDAPACPVTSNAYDAPTRLSCIKDSVDICLGDSYTWPMTNDTYSPQTAGMHKFANDKDTLYLSVHAEPSIRVSATDRLCGDEQEVRWQYTISEGTPNKITAQINGVSYPITVTETEIIMPMPASLEPGDYTVSFTVGDEAVSCTTTTQVDLSLAIEGIIYSKWEDVLFVDNSDGNFTAYQWYENGSPLADQTRQYLYDPNGLPHLYFCRLTTTGGRVIYTCEIAFADATPSRTVIGSEEKPASVKMYDPAGRAVTGKPENGIYIIIEEKDGVMKARKVAVF